MRVNYGTVNCVVFEHLKVLKSLRFKNCYNLVKKSYSSLLVSTKNKQTNKNNVLLLLIFRRTFTGWDFLFIYLSIFLVVVVVVVQLWLHHKCRDVPTPLRDCPSKDAQNVCREG